MIGTSLFFVWWLSRGASVKMTSATSVSTYKTAKVGNTDITFSYFVVGTTEVNFTKEHLFLEWSLSNALLWIRLQCYQCFQPWNSRICHIVVNLECLVIFNVVELKSFLRKHLLTSTKLRKQALLWNWLQYSQPQNSRMRTTSLQLLADLFLVTLVEEVIFTEGLFEIEIHDEKKCYQCYQLQNSQMLTISFGILWFFSP